MHGVLGVEVLPHFKAIKLDVTEFYMDKEFIARCGGRIYSSYLVDVNRHVYCCELQPSYEMHWLGDVSETVPDDDNERVRLYTDLDEAGVGTDPVSYMHVRGFDEKRFVDLASGEITQERWEEAMDEADNDPEQAYEIILDAVLEHVRGNPPF